jgi:hypothetical protein
MGYGGTILIPRSPHGEIIIIRLIKLGTMRGVGMGDMRNAYRILFGISEGKGQNWEN